MNTSDKRTTPTDQEQANLYACDHCGAQMTAEENVCSRCGKVYEDGSTRARVVRLSVFDKLDWLMRNAFSISISIHSNDHRSGTLAKHSPPLEDEIANCYADDFDDDEEGRARKAECIRRDHLVSIQCYPSTSVGFYRAVHWDLRMCVEEIYKTCHREIVLNKKYNR